MFKSILLAFSLILIAVFLIFFRFAENKLAQLASPSEIRAIHIKDRLLKRKHPYNFPVYIEDYLNGIQLLEEGEEKEAFLKEVADKTASLIENDTFFVTELGHTVTFIKPVEQD